MIAAFRLTEYLGIPGACILLTMGFVISIMLISNKSLESFFGWTYKRIARMFASKSSVINDTQVIPDEEVERKYSRISKENF